MSNETDFEKLEADFKAALEERERKAATLWARAAEIAVEMILKEPDKKVVYLDRLRRYQPFM